MRKTTTKKRKTAMYNFIIGSLFTLCSVLSLEVWQNRKVQQKYIRQMRSRRNHPAFKSNVVQIRKQA